MSEAHNTPESEKVAGFQGERVDVQNIKTEIDFEKKIPEPRLKPPSLNDPDQPSPTELFGIPISPLQGRYEFLTVIGAGGAGVIYKAKQKPLGRPVAIKMIHSHLVNVTALKRFLQEAKTISTMHHPNIISVHDFGVSEENQPYMVMDFVEGTTLSDFIKQDGALEPELAVKLAMQICDGLAHAHSHNVLHRDLKPNNVMLVPLAAGELHLRVLDFGLAKLFAEDEQADHLTKTGETVGTPAYMSPEQVMGKKLSPRSDIYSLGCLLYHCLTGFVPFGGATKMETMLKQLNDQAPPFSEYDVDVSERLEALVMQLLSKDPTGRPESMTQVKEKLKALMTDNSSGQLSSMGKKEKKKSFNLSFDPKKVAIIAVPLLLVLGGGGFFWYQSQKRPEPAPVAKVEAPPVKKEEPAATKTETKVEEETKETEIKTETPVATETSQKSDEPKVAWSSVDKQFIESIKQNPQATTLSSDGLPIRNEVLYFVKQMKNLQNLNLSKSKEIGDPGLKYIEGLPLLNNLDLSKTDVTDKGVASIASLSALKKLNLSGTKVTEKGLEPLASCRYLDYLNLNLTGLGNVDLKELSGVNNLSKLNLSNTKIGDKAMPVLASMKILQTVDLSNTDLTNTGLKKLCENQNLKTLVLSNTKITAQGLTSLTSLPSLANLDLSGVKLGKGAVAELCKLKAPQHLILSGLNSTEVLPIQQKFNCTVETR